MAESDAGRFQATKVLSVQVVSPAGSYLERMALTASTGLVGKGLLPRRVSSIILRCARSQCRRNAAW
jgi:hypothetical protein